MESRHLPFSQPLKRALQLPEFKRSLDAFRSSSINLLSFSGDGDICVSVEEGGGANGGERGNLPVSCRNGGAPGREANARVKEVSAEATKAVSAEATKAVSAEATKAKELEKKVHTNLHYHESTVEKKRKDTMQKALRDFKNPMRASYSPLRLSRSSSS
ncbi:hypothetical protein NE237_001230 [Protea cynaroides]|uniref:Uncharacterized protein n=1 Tax=Protea cynaroides TaxID=273540 RepID=A0A9Q0QY82_9MAGN|nr:hypothetical protein NE237_001230 [Protea cynaroides]